MAHYVFNFSSGDRERAAALLRAKMWEVGRDERHRDELGPGDLALIYVASPERAFIGRAVLATAVHDWTPRRRRTPIRAIRRAEWCYPTLKSGTPRVSMNAAVQRIDPTASNPLVQANAAAGFRMGVVRITGDEYEAALALSHEPRGT
jgi:hypothetical protein